jgi:predicted deacylase
VQPVSFASGDACKAGAFTVIDGFSGARRGKCTVLSDNHVRLRILPESEGYINDSPWYAFKLLPSEPGTAEITLRYEGGHHRYWPKISTDGLHWTPLDEQYVSSSSDGQKADFKVALGTNHAWIAAQEIITPVMHAMWNHKTSSSTGVPLRVLGSSVSGQPIHAFDSNAAAPEILFLISRQHPAEVSGAIAFFAFAETLFGDSDLARAFRERFRIVAIPLINPDGVISGNWRHNLNGIDLNRDWGPFTQPETQLIASLLDEFDATDSKLRMFVDFHSTRENLFYPQFDVTHPAGFTTTWLENARPRLSDYPFAAQRAPVKNSAIAKNYIYTRYGIPAVTFEVGEETDRDATRNAARVFAEELMKLMIDQEY